MNFSEFENTFSKPRINRYFIACNYDKDKAMRLYRLNLKLSQEAFTIISCFEIALRNKIDYHYTSIYGMDWLKNSISQNGIFNNSKCIQTERIIIRSLNKLGNNYTHSKLIAEMDFGFWRYLFSQPQFNSAGQSLLAIFPSKPKSSKNKQYNNKLIFNELKTINDLRNSIAHHEPICFKKSEAKVETNYISNCYKKTIALFDWMQINEKTLLHGVDHIAKFTQSLDNNFK